MGTETVQIRTESGGILKHYRVRSDVTVDNRTYVDAALLILNGS